MKTAKGGNNMKTAKIIVVGVEVAKRTGVSGFGCTVINAAQQALNTTIFLLMKKVSESSNQKALKN